MSICLCWTLAFLQAIAACVEWFLNSHQSFSRYLLHSPGSLHTGASFFLVRMDLAAGYRSPQKKFELFF